MTSPQKLLTVLVPLFILVCYGLIRFVKLPRKCCSNNETPVLNVTTVIRDEVHKAIEDGILVSDLYESDFPTVQNGVCPNFGQDLHLLVIVVTKSYHRSRRMAIRKTWGHYALRNDISIAFLFGSKTKVGGSELNTYSDMIIEGNVDTDINSTLKSISMMGFVGKRCPKVQYVLKTKDDVFINIPSLLNVIHKLNMTARAIYGHLHHNHSVNREIGLKTYISRNQVLPDYLSSQAYLFPGHIAHDIYLESLKQIYISAEEIFLTGIVAQVLGIRRVDMDEFKTIHHVRDDGGRKSVSINFKADALSKQYKYWMKFNTHGHKELI